MEGREQRGAEAEQHRCWTRGVFGANAKWIVSESWNESTHNQTRRPQFE